MTEANMTQAMLIDGKVFIQQPDGSWQPGKGKTDWARIDAMTDGEIEANALSDPDSLPFTDEEWAKAVALPAKCYIHLGVDDDVLAWFKQDGRGYQTRMNAVLRRYVEARKRAG